MAQFIALRAECDLCGQSRQPGRSVRETIPIYVYLGEDQCCIQFVINYDICQRVPMPRAIRFAATLACGAEKFPNQKLVLDCRQNVLLQLKDAELVGFLQTVN